MDNYQSERILLDRELRNETRERMSSLSDCKETREPLFVTDWFDDGVNVVGIGCTRAGGATAKLTLDVAPGLFLVSADVQVLRTVAALLGFPDAVVYEDLKYEANNFHLFDTVCDPHAADDVTLVKIVTPKFLDAVILYHRLKRDPKAYRYASVTQYWDATKQVLFELIVRCRHQTTDVPKVTYRWFDSALRPVCLPPPELPVITFDIETVSTDPDRVPTGEDVNDVLFTSSVHHVNERTLYTLVYLPIGDRTPWSLKEEMLRIDEYPGYGTGTENVVEVFTSELDLLKRTVQLLRLDGRHHYLVGYNSLAYDIKYLLVRCHFYGLPTERFVWKDGYTFGFDQIHVDMFRIAMMRYKYQRYSLSHVAKQLLHDDKVDVDAVALRYTFQRMRKHQRLYSHHDADGGKKCPSLRDTLHYNNRDTLLVSELIERTRAVDYLVGYAHECRVPLYSMNTNYNKMQYKVLNECLVLGLGRRKFLSTLKDGARADLAIPVPPPGRRADDVILPPPQCDFFTTSADLDSLMADVGRRETVHDTYGYKRKNKYPGGANFCLGQFDVSDVQSYDYRIAYPLLIDRKNLSDETAELMPANVVALMYDFIGDRHRYTVYDYTTHVGDTKTETKVMYYQYLYCGTYCGGQFPFTKYELQQRGAAPVIVVWHGRRGVLADIITVFNDNRERTKYRRKVLDGVLARVEATLQEYVDLEKYAADHGGGEEEEEAAEETTAVSEGNDDDFGEFAEEAMEEEQENGVVVVEEVVEEERPTGGDGGGAVRRDDSGFRFENDIVRVFANGTCSIDDAALQRSRRPAVDVLKQLLLDVGIEREEVDSSYRLQKSRVASIYGCIGSLKPRLAALITCMIRTTLLNSGRYLIERHGCRVYYCDTDSLFLTNPSGENMSAALNALHPHTEIEMKSIERCMFVQTKIYYYWSDGAIKYGHNVNGPRAWNRMVEFFCSKTDVTTVDDVKDAFVKFFRHVIDEIVDDDAGGAESLLRVTQDVKVKASYKTMTPANELKTYLNANYPAMAGAFRHNVYYHKCPYDITKTVYRPSFELLSKAGADTGDMRRTKREILKTVNLLKYYHNMFKTVFNIIMFNVKKNNEPYNVTLHEGDVRRIMLDAYMDVTEPTTTTDGVVDNEEEKEERIDEMARSLATEDGSGGTCGDEEEEEDIYYDKGR